MSSHPYIKNKDKSEGFKVPKDPRDGNIITNALITSAIEGGSESTDWKDIKPNKNYMDIKKKAYVEQKKREKDENWK